MELILHHQIARMGTNVRAHQPEALARSGFQPYRPDERTAAAGVYPPLDAFPPFNTMPLQAGVCYFGHIHGHLN